MISLRDERIMLFINTFHFVLFFVNRTSGKNKTTFLIFNVFTFDYPRKLENKVRSNIGTFTFVLLVFSL